jgi:hypothetical protein
MSRFPKSRATVKSGLPVIEVPTELQDELAASGKDNELAESAIARATAWAKSDPGTAYGVTEPVRAAESSHATEASRAAGAADLAGSYPRWGKK